MAKLYFRYGAMNSGKSTALLQAAYNYEERGQHVLLAKPALDTKGAERIASRLRDAAADDATARAERAGVLISIPLTAFFLPSFFVLGLIPTAISLGTHLTQGVQP